MSRNEKRRRERTRKRVLFDQLRLQVDILCDSHKQEARQTQILERMMLIILEVIGDRGLNDARRQALADHLNDSRIGAEAASIDLGGTGDRDALSVDGTFRISDLAKRITWGEARSHPIIEVDHEGVAA